MKKKKKVKVEIVEGDDEVVVFVVGEEGIDFLFKKKKKKKVVKDDDDFVKKFEKFNIEGKEGEEVVFELEEQEGDWEKGIGIFKYDEISIINYSLFFFRFFVFLLQKNFDYVLIGICFYKIFFFQCLCEGNKKIIFVNFVEICKCMKCVDEYVIVYFFVELGISGFVDGFRWLVIKGCF